MALLRLRHATLFYFCVFLLQSTVFAHPVPGIFDRWTQGPRVPIPDVMAPTKVATQADLGLTSASSPNYFELKIAEPGFLESTGKYDISMKEVIWVIQTAKQQYGIAAFDPQHPRGHVNVYLPNEKGEVLFLGGTFKIVDWQEWTVPRMRPQRAPYDWYRLIKKYNTFQYLDQLRKSVPIGEDDPKITVPPQYQLDEAKSAWNNVFLDTLAQASFKLAGVQVQIFQLEASDLKGLDLGKAVGQGGAGSVTTEQGLEPKAKSAADNPPVE